MVSQLNFGKQSLVLVVSSVILDTLLHLVGATVGISLVPIYIKEREKLAGYRLYLYLSNCLSISN